MKACCFTGHRIIKITPDLIQRLKDTIEDMIRKGVTDFYNGGACSWDLLCAETVIDLKTKHSDIKLHLLLQKSPQRNGTNYKNCKRKRDRHYQSVFEVIFRKIEHFTKLYRIMRL